MPIEVMTSNEGICSITLCNPGKKNAIDTAMFGALHEAFAVAAHDPAVRVVVLSGHGDDFSSGADLSEPPDDRHRLVHVRWVARAVAALHDCPKPVIAKVRGVAMGGAANLAFGCDLIVAAQSARFCEIFVQRGLSIDCGGSYVLPRLLGRHKANQVALLGDEISGSEAYDLGLVNRVVVDDELDEIVESWATRMAQSAPLALTMTKRLLQSGQASTLQQALEAESVAAAVNLASNDTKEAFRAFREKRAPVFTGK